MANDQSTIIVNNVSSFKNRLLLALETRIALFITASLDSRVPCQQLQHGNTVI